MSIIEKAVAKLGTWSGTSVSDETVQKPDIGFLPDNSVFEKAVVQSSPEVSDVTKRYEELDIGRLKDAGMVTPDSARSQIFQEFREVGS